MHEYYSKNQASGQSNSNGHSKIMSKKHSKSHKQSPASLRPFWLYGHHAVLAALKNENREKRQLLHSLKILPAHIEQYLKQQKIPCHKTDHQEMKKICGQWAVHQNLALEVMPIEKYNAENFILENLSNDSSEPENQKSCLLILDGLEDLQNIGAILRSASLLGVDAVVAGGWQENAHLARAAAGGLETIPLLEYSNLARFIDWLKKHEFWTVGLDMAGDNIKTMTRPDRLALIVGAEGKGLHRLVKEKCDLLCAIDMQGKLDRGPESLNVSVSTALAIWHFSN